MATNLIDTLNDLIRLDFDAVGAYRQAIDACEVVEIKSKLTEFKGDHEQHVQDLSTVVRAAGGTPEARRDLKGFFIEGFTAIVSRGDQTALRAMRGNEQLTVSTYKAALGETLTPDARAVVEKNFADEQRHLAWIKEALDDKLYEGKKGGPTKDKAA